MSPTVIGLIGVGIMLIFLFSGMSLSFTFALSGLIGIALIVGPAKAMNYLCTIPFTKAATYTFIVMPLFTLMGNLAFDGGLTTDAYNSARKWFGHTHGGLAVTTSVACGLFGAICGSGSITALMFTKISWPEMKKAGYDPALGLGAVVGSGPLAILIPPSIPLIMYGMNTSGSETDENIKIENLKKFYEAGGFITVGTDKMRGYDSSIDSLIAEMQILAKAGLSVQEVISCTTYNNAQAIFQDTGAIEEGLQADLIAVQGDVDESFESLKELYFIMNDGALIK